MSKLLKKVATTHRPHIAAKMTAANGYDETKHRTSAELHKAGIISAADKASLDDCVDDLSGLGDNFGGALKAAMSGEISPDKLNDDDFIRSLMDGADSVDDDGENLDDADIDQTEKA